MPDPALSSEAEPHGSIYGQVMPLESPSLTFAEPAAKGVPLPSQPDASTGCTGPQVPPTPLSETVVPGVPPPVTPRDPFETPLHSPSWEYQPNVLNAIAKTADTPFAAIAIPSPSITDIRPPLRLPSFDVLGIAAPHPDRIITNADTYFCTIGAGPLSKPDDPLHANSPDHARVDMSRLQTGQELPKQSGPENDSRDSPSVSRLVSPFTPPYESSSFNWGSFATTQRGAVDTPATSDQGNPPSTLGQPSSSASDTRPTLRDMSVAEEPFFLPSAWIAGAIQAICKAGIIVRITRSGC
jgi:hypothetical protein